MEISGKTSWQKQHSLW